MNFSHKVVLITGGSRGIGAATARKVVSSGGMVVIHYRSDKAAANNLVAELGSDNCYLVRMDLDTPGAANIIWQDALVWKDKIDVVVNNAGIFLDENREGSNENWQKLWLQTLQVNLISAADLCREAINYWQRAQVSGAIINVASRAAFRGDDPDHWAYAASKGGLVSLTKTLARAYSGQEIYTYCVAPGFVMTDMAESAFDQDPTLRDRLIQDIPHGDIAPADQIANAICFLASGLATHATGQTLDINGASYVR